MVAAATGGACTSPHAVPIEPLTLVAGVAQPRGAAPAAQVAARVAARLQHATLLRLARDCRVLPGLAEISSSADGLAWTITVRDGLAFHDGSPIDAEAVASVLRAEVSAPPSHRRPGLRDVSSVDVAAPRRVLVRTTAPSALLPEALATLEITGGRGGEVGAGPFRPEATGAPPSLALRSFPAFGGGAPSLSRLVLSPYDTPRHAWAALVRGDVDLLYEVPPESVRVLAAMPGVDVHTALRPFVYLVGLNTRHPHLGRAGVRRALSAAVDRDALVARVLDGHGRPALDPVWPLHWAVSNARAVHAVAAPSALAATVSFTCLVPTGVPLLERLALWVQRALRDVGVDMRLEAMPLDALQARVATGRFDAYLLEANAFGLNWTSWFWHSETGASLVRSGYAGADAALDRVRRARDDSQMRAAVAALRERFAEDAPALFLCWAESARATSKRVALPEDPDTDVLASLARWQPAPRERGR